MSKELQNGTEIPQTAAGGLIQLGKWNTDLVKVVWSVKWATSGLMPIRPILVLFAEGNLPSGKALKLSK